MKKLYTLICIIGFLFAYTGAQAQVLVLEDFENPAAQDLVDFPGWTTGAPPFDVTTTDPCEGSQSISGQLEIASTAPFLQFVKYPTPPPTGVQLGTGMDIEISFQYKIVDQVSDQLATADFGTLTLSYTVDGGATWTSYDVIDVSDLPTLDCSLHSQLITGVPVGANFGWKLEGAFNLNYPDPNGVLIYVDDFKAVEQVTCIQPINAGVDVTSVDFDSAIISWEDMNTTAPGQWEVIVCTSEGDPNLNPFCDTPVSVSGSPYTVPNLNDGTDYYVYIRSVCGPNDKSAWTGPINFQTTAIGSTCNPPIEINADPNNPTQADIVPPYVHISQTDIYGADDELAGSAGGNCGGGSVDLLDGYEVVYHYISAIDDIISIDVTGLTANNVGVFVYDDCADIGTLCLDGAVTDSGSDLNVNSLQVGAGQDIYIVIASIDPAQNGGPVNTDYTLNITGFECLTFPVPVNNISTAPYIFFATGQTLDYFMSSTGYIVPTIDFATVTWYADLADIPNNPITDPSTIVLSDLDDYYVTQTVKGCESPALHVIFNEFNCLTDLTGIASIVDDEVCESGIMTLSATGSTPDIPSPNIYWYENATGGEPLANGATFTTPDLSQTTSYWVTEAFVGEGLLEHQANPGPSSFSESSADEGVTFTADADFVIIDVKVYVTSNATSIAIALEEAGEVVKGPKIIPITPGTTNSPSLNTLTLNWPVEAGTTYNLIKVSATGGGDPSMLVDDNASFPYALSTIGEVTGSTSGSDYYYFYDWTITGPEILCEESPRTEVTATVHPIIPTSVSADDLLICVGTSTILHVTSANTDYVYNWSWIDVTGTPQTDTGPNITVTPLQNTTFKVTAVDSVTTCSFENEIDVDVYGVGSLPVDPATVELCLGETVELTAGGVRYDFENTTSGWTTVNNCTAPNGDATTANWTNVSSPFTPPGGQLEISSNDNSNFYIASAHLLGPAASLDVELISPPLDLVGTNGASISFYHHLNFIETQATEGKVEVSVNNLPWETLKTYDGGSLHDIDIGTPGGFVQETIDISNYVGYSNVRIRFHFTGEWGWWWAIDNFTLNRNYINGTISWSPGTDLYFDQQATLAYDGSPVNVVYYNGLTAGTHTYTATLDVTNCGMVTQDVTVTVHDTPLPTAADPQSFDLGQTVADLVVTGQNLTWYVIDLNGNYDQVSVNTPLVNGETYYVSQTLNNCESGMVPITVNFTCPAASDLEVSAVGLNPDGTAGEAIFVWTAPSGSAFLQFHYDVEVVMNPGTANESLFYQGTVPSGQPFAIIEDLPCETDFEFTLTTVCEGGPIPVNSNSFSVVFQTPACLAIDDFKFEGLSYYPNPTVGEVFFENNMPIEEITVYNLNGQQVFKKQIGTTKTSIDFSTLATGTYLATIEVNGSTKVIRIIKE